MTDGIVFDGSTEHVVFESGFSITATEDFSKTGFVVYRKRKESFIVQMCNGREPTVQLPNGWELYGVYPCQTGEFL